MNELLRFHHDMAYAAIAVNFGAGIWMLLSLKFKHWKRYKYFYTPVYAGWLAICVQGFLGISLYMSGYEVDQEKGFHYFYGFIAMMTAAILYSYTKTLGSKKILIYGISSLFLAGIGTRSALLVLL